MLPYLERSELFHAINFQLQCITPDDFALGNQTAAAVTIDTFLCPSDARASAGPLGPNSYRANRGRGSERLPGPVHFFLERDDGAFVLLKRYLPLSEFTDGLSSTLAFSEKPVGTGVGGPYHPFRDWIHSRAFVANPLDWPAACAMESDTSRARLDAGSSWLLTGAIFTHFFALDAPNSPIPDCGHPGSNGSGSFTARSYHPQGVNAAMADGSVRWFASTVDLDTWRSHGTRNRGD